MVHVEFIWQCSFGVDAQQLANSRLTHATVAPGERDLHGYDDQAKSSFVDASIDRPSLLTWGFPQSGHVSKPTTGALPGCCIETFGSGKCTSTPID